MAGDYKSYSIRTGLTIALCILWILLPQIQSFRKVCLRDDVFLNTSLRVTITPAVTITEGHTEARRNWSPLDRSPLQSIRCCAQNSLTKKPKNYTVSCMDTCQQTTYTTCKKFNKQMLCTTVALPEMSDVNDAGDDPGGVSHAQCNIQGVATRASATLLAAMGLGSSDLPWKPHLQALPPTHSPTFGAYMANDKKNPKSPKHPKMIWIIIIAMLLGLSTFTVSLPRKSKDNGATRQLCPGEQPRAAN